MTVECGSHILFFFYTKPSRNIGVTLCHCALLYFAVHVREPST